MDEYDLFIKVLIRGAAESAMLWVSPSGKCIYFPLVDGNLLSIYAQEDEDFNEMNREEINHKIKEEYKKKLTL